MERQLGTAGGRPFGRAHTVVALGVGPLQRGGSLLAGSDIVSNVLRELRTAANELEGIAEERLISYLDLYAELAVELSAVLKVEFVLDWTHFVEFKAGEVKSALTASKDSYIAALESSIHDCLGIVFYKVGIDCLIVGKRAFD